MAGSVMTDIKQLLGIEPDDDSFDLDVRIHINAALAQLHNMCGIEFPKVSDRSVGWQAVSSDDHIIPLVKDYVYLFVRLLFDPPSTSFANDAIKANLKELGWRISTFEEGYNGG